MAEAARVIEARPEAGSAAIDLRDVINELSQVSTRLKNVFIETHPQLSQIGDSANANRQVAASNANVVEPGPEPAAAAAAPSTIADPILGAKIVQGLGTAASVFKTIVTLLDLANQTSNLAELLTKCGVNTAGVLVAAADLAAIYYIEQGLNIQLEYDQKILDMLQSTADQYRIKKM
jgi:hypothetical protein